MSSCTLIKQSEGSTLLTYNGDCAECDWRLNKVPARDWPEGSMRPLYLLTSTCKSTSVVPMTSLFYLIHFVWNLKTQLIAVDPRQVRDDRGVTWSPDNLEDLPQRKEWETMTGELTGYIPQVAHTYALIEGFYGIMNEFQVRAREKIDVTFPELAVGQTCTKRCAL